MGVKKYTFLFTLADGTTHSIPIEIPTGDDGGYYLPKITQVSDSEIEITFVPSVAGMPSVDSVRLKLQDSGGNVAYDEAQNLTDEQKAQARENIGAQPKGNYLTEVPEGYAKKTDIPSLDGYAKTTDIPSLDGYAKTEDVPTDAEIIQLIKDNTPEPSGGGIAVTGATVGQTVKISAVDENGVPTAWLPTDFPSGGLELVASVQLEERVVSVELPLSKPCNELVVQIHSDNRITGSSAMFCTVADDVATPVTSRVSMRINDRKDVWLAGNTQTGTSNPKRTITSRVHLSSNASVSTMGINTESSGNGYASAVYGTQVDLFEDTSISKITLYGHDSAHHFYAGVKITVWGS